MWAEKFDAIHLPAQLWEVSIGIDVCEICATSWAPRLVFRGIGS
jgi:hypothetical protein